MIYYGKTLSSSGPKLTAVHSLKGIFMANIEILGRPQYRSRKHQEEQEHNQAAPKESKKRPTDPDLEYERDVKDWWWCDDV